MDAVLVLVAALLLLGGTGVQTKPAPPKPPKPPPDEECPAGVEYDGPELYGDIRKSDKAEGLTPAEQLYLAETLDDVMSSEGLVLGPGLCTREKIAEAMVMPYQVTPDNPSGWPPWEVLLGALVFGQASGKGIVKWPLLSNLQRQRIAILSLAVVRHEKPPQDGDVEDEAADIMLERGSVTPAIAAKWVVANKPLQTPPSWAIPAPHNTRKQGQTLHDWWTNFAFYWVYKSAPPKIILPQHQVWVPRWNQIAALVTAEQA